MLFLSAAVAVDLRCRRVPNLMTGSAMLVGTSLSALLAGPGGLASALGGGLLALMILTPPFALGGVGGGDVKMMGAVGTFVGPKLVLYSLCVGLILGGVLAAVTLFRHGRLRQTLSNVIVRISGAVATRSLDPLRVATDDPEAVTMPYSVPLALGTIAAVGYGIARG